MCKPDLGEIPLQGSGGANGTEGVNIGRHRLRGRRKRVLSWLGASGCKGLEVNTIALEGRLEIASLAAVDELVQQPRVAQGARSVLDENREGFHGS